MPAKSMYRCIGCISGPSASMRSRTDFEIGSGDIIAFCAVPSRASAPPFPPKLTFLFVPGVLRSYGTVPGEPTELNSAPWYFGVCFAVTATAYAAPPAAAASGALPPAPLASSPFSTFGERDESRRPTRTSLGEADGGLGLALNAAASTAPASYSGEPFSLSSSSPPPPNPDDAFDFRTTIAGEASNSGGDIARAPSVATLRGLMSVSGDIRCTIASSSSRRSRSSSSSAYCSGVTPPRSMTSRDIRGVPFAVGATSSAVAFEASSSSSSSSDDDDDDDESPPLVNVAPLRRAAPTSIGVGGAFFAARMRSSAPAVAFLNPSWIDRREDPRRSIWLTFEDTNPSAPCAALGESFDRSESDLGSGCGDSDAPAGRDAAFAGKDARRVATAAAAVGDAPSPPPERPSGAVAYALPPPSPSVSELATREAFAASGVPPRRTEQSSSASVALLRKERGVVRGDRR